MPDKDKIKSEISQKAFSFKADDISDDGIFTGYAAVFGNVDLGGDVITHGAFKRTIDHNNGRVPVLWQHNSYMPIGDGLEMSEDEKGLWVKAQLNLDMQAGKDAHAFLKAGVKNKMPRGLSIGYDIIKDSWDRITGNHFLIELRLWEYSIATFPMNEVARVDAVKSAELSEALKAQPELLYIIDYANTEIKEGRVLSNSNASLVRNAIEALQALLNSATAEDSSKANNLANSNPVVPDSVHAEMQKLLNDMRLFNFQQLVRG